MKSYWSCSKFADWVRGTPTLSSGTQEEWSDWEKLAKTKSFRYWLAEEGLDYLQNFICWPLHRIRDLRFYINNRWVTKNHSFTSNLKRGQWYDFDDRLLNAVFDELINFVEIEQAWMQVAWSQEDRKKYKTPWYRTFFRVGVWRCQEAGIDYLNWAASLKNDEEWRDKNDPDFGQSTFQALTAQETLVLYNWWKNERPKRPDPMEASGLSAYYEKSREEANDRDESFFSFLGSKRDEHSEHLSDLCHKIEKEQQDEDTAMLIRLINIRQSLWS